MSRKRHRTHLGFELYSGRIIVIDLLEVLAVTLDISYKKTERIECTGNILTKRNRSTMFLSHLLVLESLKKNGVLDK